MKKESAEPAKTGGCAFFYIGHLNFKITTIRSLLPVQNYSASAASASAAFSGFSEVLQRETNKVAAIG